MQYFNVFIILLSERRLSKVKGTNKKLTSKDMISVLQQTRDDYMSRLISSSAEQLSAFAPTEGDKEIAISYVEVIEQSFFILKFI